MAAGRFQLRNPPGVIWTPALLPGLLTWYDASDAASITQASGVVSQWNDKSGNGYHLTQAASGQRPLTGSRSVNGRNVLDFDGTDDVLANTAFSLTGNTFTVYAVALNDSNGVDGRVVSVAAAGNNDWSNTMGAALLHGFFANAGVAWSSTNPVQSNSVPQGSAFQYTAQRNGGTWAGWYDRNAMSGSTGTATTAFAATNIAVGGEAATAADYFNGAVAEVILYTSVHGSTDRAIAEAYLKAKWGTP